MEQPTITEFCGVYAANILPLHADYTVDELALARHVESIATTPGITGFLTNGHAGEIFSTDRAEKRRILEIVREAVGRKRQIIAGVCSENSLEAATQARDAETAGADAILIFPPFSWALSRDKRVVVAHHRTIIEATGLPIMLYGAPVSSGVLAYEPELWTQLVQLPRVAGIKEGSWETARYDANRRLIRKIAPHVAVMASGDEHLFTCFVLGTEGSQVSIAAIIPDTVVALYEAVRRGDLATAREMHNVIYPLAKAIYGTYPGGHATARIKACLRILGRLSNDTARPPIGSLDADEHAMLNEALRQSGLVK